MFFLYFHKSWWFASSCQLGNSIGLSTFMRQHGFQLPHQQLLALGHSCQLPTTHFRPLLKSPKTGKEWKIISPNALFSIAFKTNVQKLFLRRETLEVCKSWTLPWRIGQSIIDFALIKIKEASNSFFSDA